MGQGTSADHIHKEDVIKMDRSFRTVDHDTTSHSFTDRSTTPSPNYVTGSGGPRKAEREMIEKRKRAKQVPTGTVTAAQEFPERNWSAPDPVGNYAMIRQQGPVYITPGPAIFDTDLTMVYPVPIYPSHAMANF